MPSLAGILPFVVATVGSGDAPRRAGGGFVRPREHDPSRTPWRPPSQSKYGRQ